LAGVEMFKLHIDRNIVQNTVLKLRGISATPCIYTEDTNNGCIIYGKMYVATFVTIGQRGQLVMV